MDVNGIDLDEIERLAAAATEGPWRTDGVMHDAAEDGHPVLGGGPNRSMAEHMITWVGEFCNRNAAADAQFIAASREAVPALVAELRRLRAVVQDRDEQIGRVEFEAEALFHRWKCPNGQHMSVEVCSAACHGFGRELRDRLAVRAALAGSDG